MVLKPDVRRPTQHACDQPSALLTNIEQNRGVHDQLPPDRRELPPILITDGDKGGVGKSFLARILTYLLSSHGQAWQGFDLDPRNGHLERFHKEAGVIQLDWLEPSHWERLYQGVMQVDAAHVVLIDLPAQAGGVLPRELPRLQYTANRLGRPLLRFWVVSREYDSVNLLSQSLIAVPGNDTFAIRNYRNTDADKFKLWEDGKTRKMLLDSGGTELSLPPLPDGVARAIEGADIAFIDARSRLKEPWFVFDIESYLDEIEAEFAPVVRRLV